MKPLIKTSLPILLTLLSTLSAFAQSQGAGNGGDPNELAEFTGSNGQHLDSWSAVRQDFIRWLEKDKYLELELGGINKAEFKTKMLDAFRSTKIQWDDLPITVDGTPRPCENFTDLQNVRRIHCNQTNYASAMKNYDSETQYKMIGHEYFGVAGYEPNSYGVSDYPLSNQISKKLKEVTIKRLVVGGVSSKCILFVKKAPKTEILQALQKKGYQLTTNSAGVEKELIFGEEEIEGEYKQGNPFSLCFGRYEKSTVISTITVNSLSSTDVLQVPQTYSGQAKYRLPCAYPQVQAAGEKAEKRYNKASDTALNRALSKLGSCK